MRRILINSHITPKTNHDVLCGVVLYWFIYDILIKLEGFPVHWLVFNAGLRPELV